MSDAGRDDSISIGDLFAALGTTSAEEKAPAAKSTQTAAASARAASRTASDHDDTDGESDVIDVMSALGITPNADMRSSVASTRERQARSTQREEQIREQQIRSQQWQRELEEQQRRRQMQAAREAEVEEPVVETPPRKNGFGEDTTRIAEPSFLDKRDAPESFAAAHTVDLQAKAQKAAAQAETQPSAVAATPAQPELVAAPASPEITQEVPVDAAASSQSEPAPAVAVEQPAAAMAQTPVQPDQQVTIPVEAPSATPQAAVEEPASGVIKPISESAAAATAQQTTSPAAQAPHAAVPAVQQAAEVQQTPAAQLQPARSTQVIAPISQSKAFDDVVPATAAPAVQQRPSIQQPAAPLAAPMPLEAPVPEPVAVPVQPKKEKHGVNKGNVLGIILIVIALVCAALTIMLLTGTIDATTFTNLTNRNISSTEQLESSATVFDEGSSSSANEATETHAVYGYVVRGTDGATHQATETATFAADGRLLSSSIVIDAPDATQAQSLLDQLKSDFGDAVADAGLRDGEVYLTVNIDRDDLDVDSYTELLSSNMAEFKVIETGVTK